MRKLKKLYFTITGTCHHLGQDFFRPDMQVKLLKEPDNPVDKEAIRVEVDGLGLVGYVANSPYTVIGESMSAGRLYDKIRMCAGGRVLYVTDKGILCVVNKRDAVPYETVFVEHGTWHDEDDMPF